MAELFRHFGLRAAAIFIDAFFIELIFAAFH
jgi:hypothetical protein